MLCAEDCIDKRFFPFGPGSQCGTIHNDHLATPQKMTDSSGAVVWAADYKPFGEATITVSTITNNLRYPGQYFDAETGLNYNYYRDYNPSIGRYIQADPIGLEGGESLFVYAENDSIGDIDPFGLDPFIYVNDPSQRNGPVYGGIITVVNNGQMVAVVNGSHWPNPKDPSPGISNGTYTGVYLVKGHKNTTPAVRFPNPIPTNGPNPRNKWKPNAINIQIHCGFSQKTRGSQGCITVQPNQCQQLWSVLKNNSDVTVIVNSNTLLGGWLWSNPLQ